MIYNILFFFFSLRVEDYLRMKVGHLAFGQRANICVEEDNGLVHFTIWEGFPVDTSFRLLIIDLGMIFPARTSGNNMLVRLRLTAFLKLTIEKATKIYKNLYMVSRFVSYVLGPEELVFRERRIKLLPSSM